MAAESRNRVGGEVVIDERPLEGLSFPLHNLPEGVSGSLNEPGVNTFNFNKKSPVSSKIRKLIQEGKPHKQAVAIALKMNAEGRLGPRGGYLKNPKPQRCSA